MKYLDAFRAKEPLQAILSRMEALPSNPLSIMEVCGTHTVSISKFGLRSLLPSRIRLISGPGCPVCVTAQGDIDLVIMLARDGGGHKKCIIATFGDMMRVPGSDTSLMKEKARGADVRIVYSPADALTIAAENPAAEVVFFAVGFETTSPTSAATILKARQSDIGNFSIISNHKLIPPAMHSLLEDTTTAIDGFLCPGHVSAIIGIKPYQHIVERYRKGCVVSGFEPLDIMLSTYRLMLQIREGVPRVEIEYSRVVQAEGNPKALELLSRVFDVTDARWRGFGVIPQSGLTLKDAYARYDAVKKFGLTAPDVPDPGACQCGQVLKGIITPPQCPLFAKTCTPEEPAGACMVSSEGTCAAYYKYEQRTPSN
jgi:hydrogenase expression/formation protein HypD